MKEAYRFMVKIADKSVARKSSSKAVSPMRKHSADYDRESLKPYKIEAVTGQHIGDRKQQQDRVAIFAAPRAPGYMMAVLADGMGGVSGGDMAAEQVIHCAKLLFDEFSPLTHDVVSMLNTVALETHTLVKLTGISARNNPHSTFVALVLTPDRKAIWAHAGDSRLYRFRGPNCAERTLDHSRVQELVREGKITEEQAKHHPLSNLVTNGIGSHNPPYLAIGEYSNLQPGDSFMLCSDGLWYYFSDEELGAMVAMNTPRKASEALIRKTIERAEGNGDNCSLAIVKLVEPE